MKSKDQTLLEHAYKSINQIITEEETSMTPTKTEQIVWKYLSNLNK